MNAPALLFLFAACSSEPEAPPAPPPSDEVGVVDASAEAPAPEEAQAPQAPAEDAAVEEAPEADGAVEADPDAAPAAADAAPDTEPAADAEPEPEADAEPELEPNTELEAAAEPETSTEPEPEPQAAPEEPAPAGPITYALQVSRSSLLVQVFKDPDTVGAALSHDHVIAARGWSGSVTWDPNDLGACAVSFTVPVARLDVDPPKLRASVGLEGELSDSQRGEVKGNMLAKDQLWGDQHPNLRFTSTGCTAKGDKVEVAGTLNVRGVDKPVRVSMNVSADSASFQASGSFRAKATDFGFEPYSAGFGALKNKNSMLFTVNVKGQAPSP